MEQIQVSEMWKDFDFLLNLGELPLKNYVNIRDYTTFLNIIINEISTRI